MQLPAEVLSPEWGTDEGRFARSFSKHHQISKGTSEESHISQRLHVFDAGAAVFRLPFWHGLQGPRLESKTQQRRR